MPLSNIFILNKVAITQDIKIKKTGKVVEMQYFHNIKICEKHQNSFNGKQRFELLKATQKQIQQYITNSLNIFMGNQDIVKIFQHPYLKKKWPKTAQHDR